MDIDQLEAFLSIAKTKNFTKSATLLHVAQSTISAKIQTLEQSLGSTLFIRSNRSVILTPAGQTFLPYAERMVSLANESKFALHPNQQYTTTLVVGSHGSSLWAYSLLPRLTEFRKNHPEVALRLVAGAISLIAPYLLDGIVDIAVVYQPLTNPTLEVLPFYEDEMLLIGRNVPPEPFNLQDLNKQSYIHIDQGSPFNEWFEKIAGRRFLPSLHVNNSSVLLHMLLEGNGYGFMLKSMVKPYLDKGMLAIIPHDFPSPPPKRPISIAYLVSRHNDPAVKLGLELLQISKPPV